MKDSIDSNLIGKSFLNNMKAEVDGHIEINYHKVDKTKKEFFVDYKISDLNGNVVFSNKTNIYSIPYSVILYIIYETAKINYNILKPSNFITEEDEFSCAGSAQPNFDKNDQRLFKKYKEVINKYLYPF